MELLLVGMSHRTASLGIREGLALSGDEVRRALRLARNENALRETLVLSTCNRTELYALTPDPQLAEWSLRALGDRIKGGDLLAPGPHRYLHRDREAARHLLRVAAGLESMVLGEMQILGQVRDAYALACEEGSAGAFLNRLLPTALRTGKRARAETEIGAGTASVASAAVAFAAQVFGDLCRRRVLVVGAGETARLTAQHFAKRRPAALRIANRTSERAASLAAELGGQALGLEELPRALAHSDVVVCATASPVPLIDGEMVRGALREHPRESLVILDLAVPRNVEPAVAGLENVFLHAIDAVQTIVDLNLARRRRAVPRVEAIVEQELEGFLAWLRSLETTRTLRALRERFEAIRAKEVRRHGGGLTREDAERLERLTKSLVSKLLHCPTTRIKACDAGSPEGSLRLDAVRDLFGLGATDGGEDA